MAIEAPISKFKKNTLKIWVIFCIALAVYCAYDGYFNEKFKERHTQPDNTPDSTLAFNQKTPPFFIGAAVLLGVYLFSIRNKRIIAGENELVISDKEKISYNSIQRIDRTHFSSKGYFIITYKDKDDSEVNRKLSGRTYDNLAAILDELVAKIS